MNTTLVRGKSKIDVSVVLNMHREGPFLKATLASLSACALEAQADGLVCELIAVFDRTDEITERVFLETPLSGFVDVKVVKIEVGSLGLARNAGIDISEGRYIWTADGDDLVSSNAIVELYRTVSSKGGSGWVAYVNYLIAFGEIFFVSKYFDDDYLTVADFAMDHPFVSRIFIERNVFSRLRYVDLHLSEGFAYEDWEFVTRLRREGLRFCVAPETAMYYRQRPQSLLRQANGLSARLIPHTPLFDPVWYSTELEREKKSALAWSAFEEQRHGLHRCNPVTEIMNSPRLSRDLLKASRIDPEIDLARIENSHGHIAVPYHSDHWGFALGEAFSMIGSGPFTDVVLLPWLNAGGGEKYILQVLHAVAESDPDARFLVLCGEAAQMHDWANRLPRRSVLLDLYNAFPNLNDEARNKLTVRLLLACGKQGARLHIKSSVFSHTMLDAYGAVLLKHFQGIYYRFSDDQYNWRGHHLVYPSTLKLLRRELPRLSKVICDCENIARQDKERLGLMHERYHTIYAHVMAAGPRSQTRSPSYRLLWASRVCRHKRPELLAPLARALQIVAPRIQIDIYGKTDPGYDPQVLFEEGNLNYLGSFDGFDKLPIDSYDALIYTSELDGLPNVLLEAMAGGLPVIAPDVGGVSELVISGDTGYLIDAERSDDVLVKDYVYAIQHLYAEWEASRSLASAGRALIAERHSRSAFISRVKSTFGLANQPSQTATGETLNLTVN
ncbi:glycosyltransferase [Paraburkholderia sp. J63]|uniref:glycosyltransferase n=1 Tax=Paraburkholderia sp. J63 TaxID=2805434 RepID=UPI002ABE3DED|nr:glycosyltransferase [Paraburkholderia sp. J63]